MDTIVDAGWVITVDPSDQVLKNHSVVIDQGAIKAILPTRQAAQEFDTSDRVQLDTHALIPGFVNAHTHAAMALLRGLANDLPLDVWLQDHIWPAEARHVSPEFVSDGTKLAMAEMISSGTTCMNDMYYSPDIVAEVAEAVNMRACVGLIALDFPTQWANDPDEYLSKGAKVHQKTSSMDLVTTMLAPHAPYTVSDETFEKVAIMADDLELRVHIHVHETEKEISDSLSEHGERPIARLARLNLVNSRMLAVHATHLEADEMELLAESGAAVAHCPKSNLKLGSGVCPAGPLKERGVTVGIGTDGCGSNNKLDMLEELRFAALLAKGAAGDATVIPAKDALRMATIEGAKCLGLDDSIGSLEPGKQADMSAIDLSKIQSRPVYDPVAQIAYAASSEQTSDVWIGGTRVLDSRSLTTIDVEACLHAADGWARKITH